MLNPSTKFGPYEIVAPVGAGGMGEVYHAWDDRLQRAVAIKVLPPAVSADRARLQRFVREARIAGLLNHPNVLSIHDVGGLETTPYLVCELLEGETLRERLHRGPLSPQKAVEATLQIAAGLTAIHKSGIVHHDLKPENLFVLRDGRIKILDFGLARPEVSADQLEQDVATVAEDTEGEQSVSGTTAYLSPEQVQGCRADHRSDLFALGAILFELVTGQRAFARATRVQTMRAIVDDDPFAGSEASETVIPPALQRVVRHCLEKGPESRFQSASDLAFALEPLANGHLQEPSRKVKPQSRSWSRLLPVGLAVALAATVLGLLVSIWLSGAAPSPGVHTVLPLDALYDGHGIALSRDGSHLAYAALQDGSRSLYVRAMNEMLARKLPGTEGAAAPFFSYDGRWIGFVANGKLQKVALGGGAPQTLANAAGAFGASWGRDDTILFTPSVAEGIWRVSAHGGQLAIVSRPDRDKQEKSHRFPQWLPDGETALFHTHYWNISSLDDAQIEALSVETGERHIVIERGHRALYLPTGHIVYQHADSLLVAPFSVEQTAVTGPPARSILGVRPSVWPQQQVAVSQDGLLVYAPGTEEMLERRLVWVDRESAVEPVSDVEADFRDPRLSPDGRRFVVRIIKANEEVWLYELDRGVWTRLTSTWDSFAPIWTPDGERVTIGSSRTGVYNLFWIPSNGVGEGEHLLASDITQWPTSWSPDGRFLAFNSTSALTAEDIGILERGAAQPSAFLQTQFTERDAKFSPDGRWIAYSSDESGRSEVYVTPFPRSGRRWQVSTDGGQWPVWSRDGAEILYRSLAESSSPHYLMAVSLDPTWIAGPSAPEPLFDARRFGRHDVSVDGTRFLMVETYPQEAPRYFHVVSNWFHDLAWPPLPNGSFAGPRPLSPGSATVAHVAPLP